MIFNDICDINFVTFMMSNDINFVTFMMCNNLFVRHPCRIGVPWDVTVCRRLSRIYVFGSVGRFRVIILADSEFVFFMVDVSQLPGNGNRCAVFAQIE